MKTNNPNRKKDNDNDKEMRKITKEFIPYLIGFIFGVLLLKFIFYWMMKMGWLYWDDGPGYR